MGRDPSDFTEGDLKRPENGSLCMPYFSSTNRSLAVVVYINYIIFLPDNSSGRMSFLQANILLNVNMTILMLLGLSCISSLIFIFVSN